MDKNAIFGLEGQDYAKARAVVIPVPYDSMSASDGCRGGPAAIIEASQSLESYDIESEVDVADIGIFTSAMIDGGAPSVEAMIGKVSEAVAAVVKDGKVPILIGGDHTVSLGALTALANVKTEFDVISFDAHSGTRDSYNGSRYAHECNATRIRELAPCYSIDVRSGDLAGMKEYTSDILTTVEMKEMGLDNSIKHITRKAGKAIYMSFNYDFMRISDMPSVRYPEPGGLSYGKTVEMLSQVPTSKDVAGIDFVGLAPVSGFGSVNVTAAKLIQKILCNIFKQRLQ